MSKREILEKIAAAEEDYSDMTKTAAYYDQMGRELVYSMIDVEELTKVAKKLPPGMFSGRAGVAKLLGIAGVGAGGAAAGHHVARKKGEEDDVQLATRAYKAGVQRGAQAVLAKIRQQMGG